jgi:hypothetical protein
MRSVGGISMSEHAKTLEPKIRALQEGLKTTASEINTEQLLLIIHRPGFTTPQEAEFVHAMRLPGSPDSRASAVRTERLSQPLTRSVVSRRRLIPDGWLRVRTRKTSGFSSCNGRFASWRRPIHHFDIPGTVLGQGNGEQGGAEAAHRNCHLRHRIAGGQEGCGPVD